MARRVYDRIKTALLPLDRFPLMARAGRVAGTRELPVPSVPYIVVYEPEPDGVLVLSVIVVFHQGFPSDFCAQLRLRREREDAVPRYKLLSSIT